MRFTDIFIKRPVLATVVSLLILVVGLGSISKLQLSQYPAMNNTSITITTLYPGADPDVVQGFVTTPMEQSVGSADGIDYMTASSAQSTSTINVFMKLNYDPNAALTDITGKVNAVLNKLPKGTLSPTIVKTTGDDMPQLILGFTSDSMSPEQITAYITNVIQPHLMNVTGLSQVIVWGQKPYAMRIWLNTDKLAKLGVAPNDVYQALANNNLQSTPGQLKGVYRFVNIRTTTDLHTVDQFDNLVVKNDNGRLIRVKDIGYAELGAQNYNYQVIYNGKQAVFAALQTATGANPLTVVGDVLKLMPTLEKGLPPGLHMSVVYNGTTYISAAIKEVIQTIIISALVVMIVIFLFLGAFRSMLIPMVAIPLSLVGVCFLMMVLGFSLNLMTLLAMVLAIGLVVDDAIVVLENIYRHIEEGLTPFQAAIKGAREIAGPVMVMTCTLAAVFAPIGFMGGLTGALFTEFAFTLAASVVISGMIALTFSPMVCSKVITPSLMEAPMVKRVDAVLNWLKEFYRRRLTSVLNYRPVVVMVAVVVITSCYFLFQCTKSELVPTEDQSYIGVLGVTNSNANLAQLDQNTAQVESIFNSFKEGEKFFIVDGYPAQNNVLSGLILKPWGERKTSQMDLMPLMQNKVSQVPGMQAYAYSWPMIPGVKAGPGLEVVLTSTDSHEKMYPMAQSLVQKLQESGLFMFVSSDLVFDMPELDISINRDKAANLGISMSDIANALGVLLSEANVNYFSKDGYSYQVIPQLTDQNRYNPHDLDRIHVKTASGDLIPLSALVTMKTIGTPQVLNQFNQLNSATLNAVLMPFVTTGQALQYVQNLLNQTLPPGMSYDYKDATRQYVEQGNAMLYAFIFAIIVIFLLLSAQFESFRDPFIILIAVPMSICGALIPLALGVATLNIYTQIGLITLIGLISKHGILMVEFANKLQLNEGLSIREAIEKSASIRLRPILMTTATMIFGVFPLLLSEGAGAVSRFDVGLVIASGMFIGTGFTLFVVPTMYTYFAKDHRAHHEKMKALQTMPPDMHE